MTYSTSGRAVVGLYEVLQSMNSQTLTSFRLTNMGTTTATVTVFIYKDNIYYPISPIKLRLDPGDMAMDENADIKLERTHPVCLESDSSDVYYWFTVST